MTKPSVRVESRDALLVITLDRPEVKNAVDGPTAQALADAFRAFDADSNLNVAVLHGADADLTRGP